MFEMGIGQRRQTSCSTNAVIGTQRGSRGANPLAIHIGADWIGCEVMGGVGIGLRHHVDMGLQHDAFAIFHARGGWLLDDDIADCISLYLEPLFLGPVLDPGAQCGFMFGRVGNRTNLVKEEPQQVRGEIGQCGHVKLLSRQYGPE